jgi:protein ImuB
VRRCELRGGTLSERPLASKPLWSAGEHGHAPAGEMPALVEHLRARLGNAAVYGIRRVSEHRPEKAWRVAEPRMEPGTGAGSLASHPAQSTDPSVPGRPLWLLATPEPLSQQRGRPRRQGELEILQGPERIESGWWDGEDVVRDYYVARDSKGSLLWVYCECSDEGRRRWFLHGVFG